ncbi:uncharacterized protein DS421_2g39500 [Arachis hypogaea]|nr:uncharacterized protein DS421_2g39500 [Arachis hypogaea]
MKVKVKVKDEKGFMIREEEDDQGESEKYLGSPQVLSTEKEYEVDSHTNCFFFVVPRVKLAEIMDSDPEDSSNSLSTDSSVNDMDDVPKEYAMGFSESIPNLGVLGEFVEKPSYQVGPTLLCSRLKRQEFPWTSFKSEAATHIKKVWQKWVFTVLFEEGGSFVRRLESAGVAKAIRTFAEVVFSDSYFSDFLGQAKKSSSKDEHSKTRRSSRGKEVVGDKQDSKKKKITVKYSYSNWSRYFFGDFLNGEFVPAPAVSSYLRGAAFVAYWLKRLPLAPMYLGSLYTRLDQFFQQLKVAHGRFPVLSFIDEIFLQLFLFEWFSLFAPTPHPSKSLEDVIDLEENFCFRPYVTSYQPDTSAIHRIYSACLEHDRNNISIGQDGVYDFWLLCTSPTPLPGLIVMDRDFHCGALICPVIYRLDRVLFQEELPKYNPFLVVPLDRDGGVTMEYVDYLMRMKEHIRQYEGTSVPDVRSFVPVLIKDPYFMTGNLSPSTITNLNAKCYRHPPSSKRKPDDSVVTAEVVKRSKVESSNVEVAKRSLERPLGPSVDAMPSPISTGSGISPSSTAKAKGSSAAACFVESSQSPDKAVVSLSSSVVKRRSHRLLGKLKTIPNAPSDPVNVGDESSLERVSGDSPNSFIVGDVPDEGTTQEVVRDGLRAKASSKRNVDIEPGVTCQGDPTRRVVTPTRTVFPDAASHTASESTFQASSTSKITKEPLASASSVSVRDEFEHFNGDAKNLLSEIASRAPSFLLPNDLNCLFKKLGYQAFLDAWDFFTSHSLADLWGAHRDMVENHPNNLKLFKFSGRWLENLSAKLEPPPGISDLAREELLSKEHHILSSDVSALQEKVNKLTSELNTLKARLASVSMEREQLAKHKEAASSVISYSDILWL